MAYGVTPQGFNKKTFAVIEQELYDEIKNVKNANGEYLSAITRDSSDIFYQFNILTMAYKFSEVWDQLEWVYNGISLNKASGEMLDSIASLSGKYRKLGSYSLLNLTFYGFNGTVIPIGTKVSSEDGLKVFETIEEKTIPDVGIGTIVVQSQCTVRGAVTVSIGEISSLAFSLQGVNSVQNMEVQNSLGIEDEDDLRLKYRITTDFASNGAGRAENIDAFVKEIKDVKFCKTYVNLTPDTDEKGIPSGYVCSVVDGGTNEDVANGIFVKDSGYLSYHGNVSVDVKDSQGIAYTVKFQRPIQQALTIKVEVKVLNGEFWDETESPNITKENVKAYVTEKGQIGALMLASDMYAYLTKQAGIAILSASFQDSGWKQTYQLAWNKYPSIDNANIQIVVT